MALVEMKELEFTYPAETEQALKNCNLSVEPGDFILLCGPSGCGKTTLLRHLKHELTPIGKRTGEICFEGQPLSHHKAPYLAASIGMVQQDPENQTVTDRVISELVFGMENLGYSNGLMRRRAAELSHFFGLDVMLNKKTHELSGGQKQMLQLASVLALQPKLLLLDEPTAQLDPVAAKELLHFLQRINQELGLTIIISEHRFEEAFPLVDRVVVMESGKIKCSGTPQEALDKLWAGNDSQWRAFVPSIPKLFLLLGEGGTLTENKALPLTVKAARQQLIPSFTEGGDAEASQSSSDSPSSPHSANELGFHSLKPKEMYVFECRDVYFKYTAQDPTAVLKNISMQVKGGEISAILGANGTGKTTLLKLMAGILTPQKGKVLFHGKELHRWKHKEQGHRIGYVDQNPLTFFIEDTVERELEQAAARAQLSNPREEISRIVLRLRLEGVLHKHPYDLSGGERQLASLAAVLLSRPDVLLLDEPTKGLDPFAKSIWGELFHELQQEGMTIIMVTHDVEFAARYATRCAMMFDGMIAAEANPSTFFSENIYYTTTINRLIRHRFPEIIHLEEVCQKWHAHASPSLQ